MMNYLECHQLYDLLCTHTDVISHVIRLCSTSTEHWINGFQKSSGPHPTYGLRRDRFRGGDTQTCSKSGMRLRCCARFYLIVKIIHTNMFDVLFADLLATIRGCLASPHVVERETYIFFH